MEAQINPSSSTAPQAEIEFSSATEETSSPDSEKPCLFSAEEPYCWFSREAKNGLLSQEKSRSLKKLWGLVCLSLIFMVVEIAGGVKANSLAVITDAAHMFVDIGTYALSLFSIWASGWRCTSRFSYGYYRSEVLGGLVSILTIWVVCGFLIYESIERMVHDHREINGKLMFSTAAFGFVCNLMMAKWLGHGHEHGHCHNAREGEDVETAKLVGETQPRTHKNLNIQGAYLHVIGDLIQSAGVMIGGGVIWAKPRWLIVDLVCTIFFSSLVLWTTRGMFRNIVGILMEGAPEGLDVERLEAGLRAVEGVREIHDLHLSALSIGKVMLTCHVTAKPGCESKKILVKMRDYCEAEYDISHVTIQIEQD